MRTAYFSEFSTPGQDRIARAFEQLTTTQRARLQEQYRAGAPTQDWDTILARQQAIYDELVASHELAAAVRRNPHTRRPTARELTRDLAGWTLPVLPSAFPTMTYPGILTH